MQIKILTQEEQNKELESLNSLLDYLDTGIEHIQEQAEEAMSQILSDLTIKHDRTKELYNNYETQEAQTVVNIPESLSKDEIKQILMALSYLEQEAGEDKDLFSNLEEGLIKSKDQGTIGTNASVKVHLLPQEVKIIHDLIHRINETKKCYESLDESESITIEGILDRCCLPKSETSQFPASEKTWIENLKKLAINEIHTYASTPRAQRNFNQFKQDFSTKIDTIISQIERNSTLTLKLQAMIHDLCLFLHLRPRFEKSRDIVNAQKEMRQKLQTQKEEFKDTPVQSEMHRKKNQEKSAGSTAPNIKLDLGSRGGLG